MVKGPRRSERLRQGARPQPKAEKDRLALLECDFHVEVGLGRSVDLGPRSRRTRTARRRQRGRRSGALASGSWRMPPLPGLRKLRLSFEAWPRPNFFSCEAGLGCGELLGA